MLHQQTTLNARLPRSDPYTESLDTLGTGSCTHALDTTEDGWIYEDRTHVAHDYAHRHRLWIASDETLATLFRRNAIASQCGAD